MGGAFDVPEINDELISVGILMIEIIQRPSKEVLIMIAIKISLFATGNSVGFFV